MILSGAARLAGVMGWPIAHSRSPRIHGYWLEEKGIDGAYLRSRSGLRLSAQRLRRCRPSDFAAAI